MYFLIKVEKCEADSISERTMDYEYDSTLVCSRDESDSSSPIFVMDVSSDEEGNQVHFNLKCTLKFQNLLSVFV